MLKLALTFEVRSLLRNRGGVVALLAYLATGAIAILIGAGHVATWEQALETSQQAQDTSIDEARAYFANGHKGPEDRAWVDLSQPRWQDEFAATRVFRVPSPLAGIAAGSVDPAPVAFHLRPWGDPLADAGYRIENPEVAAGAIDLVFVWTILTPLLIGVLGLDIGGREREERIDRLVIVQAGEVRGWLLARAVAVTAIAGVDAGLLCLAAGLVGGAGMTETAFLVALATAYTAVWGGLLLVVVATAQTVRGGAFAFGALWMVVCVLLPAAVADVGLGRVRADFAVDQTLDARARQYSAYAQDDEDRMRALYARFPELEHLPAASDAEMDGALRRHAYMGPQLDGLMARYEARQTQDEAARRFAARASWISPPLALTVALERVAGVGPEAASAYRSLLVESLEDRTRWILVQAWKKEPLDVDAFEALVEDAPAPSRSQPQGLGVPMMALGAWLLGGWLVAFGRLARAERRRNAR